MRTPLPNREDVKEKSLGVRVTPAMHRRLTELAVSDHRSISSLVCHLLETHPELARRRTKGMNNRER